MGIEYHLLTVFRQILKNVALDRDDGVENYLYGKDGLNCCYIEEHSFTIPPPIHSFQSYKTSDWPSEINSFRDKETTVAPDSVRMVAGISSPRYRTCAVSIFSIFGRSQIQCSLSRIMVSKQDTFSLLRGATVMVFFFVSFATT